MKRLIALLLASIMVLACMPLALAESGPVEIKWSFGLGGSLGELMLSLVDDYNASQDKVHVTPQQYGSYGASIQAFHADLAAGTPPECLLFQMWYMAEFENYFAALNDRYANDADFHAEDILKGCLDCMYGTDGETIYGVPIYATTQVMYYRKDAFEGRDIEETFSTWQNLSAAAAEIAKTENGETVFFGWEPMWGSGNITDAVQSAGGKVFTDSTCRTVDWLTDEWVDVVSSFAKWIHENKIMRIHYGGSGYEYWYNTIDDVMEGRAAGYTGSVGDQGDLDFNIVGCHKQPGWGDHPSAANSSALMIVMPDSIPDEKKDAAWDFMKYLSSPAVQGKIARASGYVVTRQSCLDDPEYAAYVSENPQVIAAIDAINSAVKYYVDPTGGYVDSALGDLADKIEIENYDVIQALTEAQEEAQAALDEFWAEHDAQ